MIRSFGSIIVRTVAITGVVTMAKKSSVRASAAVSSRGFGCVEGNLKMESKNDTINDNDNREYSIRSQDPNILKTFLGALIPQGHILVEVNGYNNCNNGQLKVPYSYLALTPSIEVARIIIERYNQNQIVSVEADVEIETYSAKNEMMKEVAQIYQSYNRVLPQDHDDFNVNDNEIKLWFIQQPKPITWAMQTLAPYWKSNHLLWATENDVQIYAKKHKDVDISRFVIEQLPRFETKC